MNKIDREILSYYLKKFVTSREELDKSLYCAVFEVLSPAEAKSIVTRFTDYKHFSPHKAWKIAGKLEDLDDTPAQDVLHSALSKLLKGKRQINPKIADLSRVFDLSPCEEEILQVYYLYKMCPTFADAVQCRRRDYTIFLMLGYTSAEVELALCNDEHLKNCGLMEHHEISNVCLGYLMGNSSSLLEYATDKTEGQYPLESFPVDKKIIKSLTTLLSNVPEAKILLHGACGTGKTQFAASLVNNCGKNAYFLKSDMDVEFALSAANPEKDVVIIDEADDIFNERIYAQEQKKSGVNKTLDRAKCQSIYISNSVESVDPSVLRRFHYILEFKPLKNGERAKIWATNIQELSKFLSPEEIASISEEYNLPVGIVANSAKAAILMTKKRQERKFEFLTLLKSHQSKKNEKAKSVKQFDVNYLHTNISVESIINHAKQYSSGDYMGTRRFSMLFHGMPGTGKSEFAKYLADFMGYNAKVVLGSDIFSKWVGGSEKNIRNAFESAQGDVLIFDEADSMLSNREDAHRSWERTQVNEFLAQMDSFKGVLICTTNHLHTLDSAAIRRFDRKVEFLPLRKEQICHIAGAYFPKLDFDGYAKELGKLNGITPGDIAVVSGRFWDDEVKETDIIEALADELSYKKNKEKVVGFDR